MKAMEALHDLIEEAKLRTVWWALCIFAISYFLTHTSKSMWMNLPVAILLVSGTRILLNEVEFRWKVRKTRPLTYLSHLEKKRLSVNDSRLSTSPSPPKSKRKIESPMVKAAMEDFINKLLQDFVVDLWYSDISPDKEAPELMRELIMDVLAEISTRVKEINLVELLTRDVVDLVGDHLELFRQNQAAIGVDVMITLSSEERDERLKHHLMASKELHPALISPECEYKFLKRIMGAVLAVVLKPREGRCSLVRCIARELLTSLVMEPLMRFASPESINELIEVIFLATTDEGRKEAGEYKSSNIKGHNQNQASATKSVKSPEPASMKSGSSYAQKSQDETNYSRPADWARVLDAATQRRTEVLQPENLDNMWTKGRNYKKRAQKNPAPGLQPPIKKGSGINIGIDIKDLGKKISSPNMSTFDAGILTDLSKTSTFNELDEESSFVASGSRTRLKRSNSTSDLNIDTRIETTIASPVSGSIISEFYNANADRPSDVRNVDVDSSKILRVEEYVPKLRCRVLGAFFEKLGSNSFAVYSIAVTDADNKTWFVKRRYRNFEKLHRNLKDIPNYKLHLPPKRIFSSSTEDAFVHQRCIQLDKYLQDLLSIANVAERHEVWDFLSGSSKNYSFGKSSSVMRTLAVNVDDAVDDIVRQFKGASDGLKQKVVDISSPYASRQITSESAYSVSDNEEYENVESSGWHSDNELNSKGFPPRVVKFDESSGVRSGSQSHGANVPSTSGHIDDLLGVPAEWTPRNVSVPLINLVDKIFQLNRRGWLRRQVFLMSKQILHLMMEDAIDDWLLRQIHWLRRDDVVAHGIRWIQDVLWPEGTFFMRLNTKNETNSSESSQGSSPSSASKVNKQGSTFEEQLEAARRASDVKRMIIDGAPATLVSLIGHKQYKRCAGDVYDFLQSCVCLKQLGYSLLELLLITIFPELQDIISDVHENGQSDPV